MSHSTVSRALRNSPLIPEITRERIQQIAEQHGFSASAVARSLATRRTMTIGVVVTSIADPFNAEIVGGIEEVANRAGYSVVLATSQADPEREMAVVRSFSERRMDGILVASSRVGALYRDRLASLRVPLVLINNQGRGSSLPSVTIDNRHGAELATKHLVKCGHTRIAYLGDSLGLQSDKDRKAGYRTALKRAGLAVRPELVVHGDGKLSGARAAAAELLEQVNPPTAIFCYNDMSALGVLAEAEARGLQIPNDLSVCGFDDLLFTPFLKPALTTVHQPKTEIGQRATELLFQLLRGGTVERGITLRGSLVIRDSTAAPRRPRKKPTTS